MAPMNQTDNSLTPGTTTASSDEEFAFFDQTATNNRNGHTTDLVRLYLQDIGRVPLLERDEELTEARKVQNYIQLLEKRQALAEEGDEVLATFLKLIEVHDRLAIDLGCRPSMSR